MLCPEVPECPWQLCGPQRSAQLLLRKIVGFKIGKPEKPTDVRFVMVGVAHQQMDFEHSNFGRYPSNPKCERQKKRRCQDVVGSFEAMRRYLREVKKCLERVDPCPGGFSQ